MSIDPKILAVLACPECRAPLDEINSELLCTKCSLAYPIRDGIPVLLIDQARKR
jgi:uncharacterized protein YbaR (Trm112 family)